MANLDQIQLPDNTTYDIISKTGRGLVRATMNDTTSTSTAFVVEASGITSLYDGLTIVVKNTKVASASGCTLQLNDLAAKRIIRSSGGGYVTTHWALNTTYLFVYNGTNDRWEMQQGYLDGNTNTWRGINVDGTALLGTGTGTGAINFVSGDNVTLTGSGNDLTIAATDTTYTGTGAISVDSSTHVISTTAEANQNAFSNVKVGSTTIAADSKTDTLELAAGSNVTLTPDATNNTITIAATDTTYSDATTSASGLMSASDKTKLNGIATGAEVNVQANWTETSSSSDAYIKNKPTIPTKTSDLTNDSGFLTSLSGAVLTSASGEQLITTTGAGNGSLNLKNSVIDITKSNNNVSSGTYYYGTYIKDKNGINIGKSAVGVAASGLIQYQIYVQNKQSASSSASNIQTSINLNQEKSSTKGNIECNCQYMQINGDTKVTGYLGIGSKQTAGMTGSTQNLGFWADGPYPGESTYRLHLSANYNTTWAWVPETSGKLALGTSGKKWTVVYANNGTIQTSDRTKKKDIDYDLENFNNFYKELKPVSYKFIDGTSGRTHVGFIAQDVEESLENNDLTALDFAGFCKDQKSKDILDNDGVVVGTEPIEGEYDYSLRYDEFVALNTHMIQKLMNRVDELEATIVSQNKRIIQLEAKVDKLMS